MSASWRSSSILFEYALPVAGAFPGASSTPVGGRGSSVEAIVSLAVSAGGRIGASVGLPVLGEVVPTLLLEPPGEPETRESITDFASSSRDMSS